MSAAESDRTGSVETSLFQTFVDGKSVQVGGVDGAELGAWLGAWEGGFDVGVAVGRGAFDGRAPWAAAATAPSSCGPVETSTATTGRIAMASTRIDRKSRSFAARKAVSPTEFEAMRAACCRARPESMAKWSCRAHDGWPWPDVIGT